MRTRFGLLSCALGAAGLLPCAGALAHDDPAPGPAPAAAPAEDPARTATGEEAQKLKTLFKNLRFEEDWTALADPAVETDHWWPWMKYAEITPGWSLSFGGQLRYRYMSEGNRSLKGTVPGQNTYSLYRERLHAEMRAGDDARIFVEVLNAGIRGSSTDPAPIDRQTYDFQNAFVEWMSDPDLRLRLGRTELQYGAQRFVSPLDWANTRRTFDGGVLQTRMGDWKLDLFLTHPVMVDQRVGDQPTRNQAFGGAYGTWAIDKDRLLDTYLFLLNDNHAAYASGDGSKGALQLYTLGARYAAKTGDIDYEGEAAHQFGTSAGDTVDAWAWTARGGWTLADTTFTPRLGLDLDYASGDSDPTDSRKETFNQLYPLGHAWLGYLDLVGRQNIFAIMPNATFKTTDTTSFRAAWSRFELVNRHDSLYNAGGKPSLTDTTGSSGSHVGDELDLTLAWKPRDLAPHGEFLFGYSYFFPGAVADNLGDGDSANLVYVQYTHTF